MWDLTDGSAIRDLLTVDTTVHQVAFEGQWCAATSSNPGAPAVMHIWDFGAEVIENRIGELSDGFSDDTTDDEYEEEDAVMMDVNSLEIARGGRDPGGRMN